MRVYILLFLAVQLFVSCSGSASNQSEAETTLILVRHAEKIKDGSGDPGLTKKGEARANMLAGMMSLKGLDVIYSTPFERNLNTVMPTANALDIAVIEYNPSRDLGEFLTEVLNKNTGKRILICGHSNTIPEMLNILGGKERFQQLAEDDYDNLYFVNVDELGMGMITEANFVPENW